jgi:hypothetical protein
MDERMEPVEMRLMTLGAALVGCRVEINGEESAHIVADAMEHIAKLKRQIVELRDGGKPTKTRREK